MSDALLSLHELWRDIGPALQKHCREPWLVIGSAAMALLGANVDVADVDLLTSTADAERLLAHWHDYADPAPPPAHGPLFRSHFGRFRFVSMPVEVMGGLEVQVDGHWEAVQVSARHPVDIAGYRVMVPDRLEQIRLLQRFDRPKDRQRAAVLQALGS